MKYLALAILSVGLCFYNIEVRRRGGEENYLAGVIATIAALELIILGLL